MNHKKTYILIGIVILIIGAIYLINTININRDTSSQAINVTPRVSIESSQEKAKRYQLAKEITTPDGFINTPSTSSGQATPITINEFIGKKVVLIDFWTYSCINCQRTIPYLNSWYEKYKDEGFVIIGIHTPEFEFEKDYNNVKRAVEKFGIKYPVVLDNDYSTWNAYKNRYWPRKYLIDIDGYIVYDHIGEGAYEKTEKKIQEALAERMAVLEETGTINQEVTEETSLKNSPESPETYFGASRNEFLGNGRIGVLGQQKNIVVPTQINSNTLYLSGDWNVENEFAQNTSDNAGIIYKYTAKEVFFVAEADSEIIIEVLLDGSPVNSKAGEDIVKIPDGKTILRIKEAGLYKIIQSSKSETHILKLIIQNQGLKAFTFTFG